MPSYDSVGIRSIFDMGLSMRKICIVHLRKNHRHLWNQHVARTPMLRSRFRRQHQYCKKSYIVCRESMVNHKAGTTYCRGHLVDQISCFCKLFLFHILWRILIFSNTMPLWYDDSSVKWIHFAVCMEYTYRVSHILIAPRLTSESFLDQVLFIWFQLIVIPDFRKNSWGNFVCLSFNLWKIMYILICPLGININI